MELLAIIAIIVVMGGLAVGGMRGESPSRRALSTAVELSSLLELARTEAVSRQSYVWVVLKELAVGNTLEVHAVALYSGDGTTALGANLVPLTQVRKFRHVGLKSFSDLNPATVALLDTDTTVSEVFDSTAGIVYTRLPMADFQEKKSITFTPRGEAMLTGAPTVSDGFDPFIGIGIVPATGGVKGSGVDDVGVVIEGSTGTTRILRDL